MAAFLSWNPLPGLALSMPYRTTLVSADAHAGSSSTPSSVITAPGACRAHQTSIRGVCA